MKTHRKCTCGRPITSSLLVHYRYPRLEHLPEAVDPWYVHGGGGRIETCGNPRCEPDAYLAARERIIGMLSAEQAATLDLEVSL